MIRPLSIEAALWIVRRMRPESREEIMAQRRDYDDESYAWERYRLPGAGWVIYTADGEPAVMGGIVPETPVTATLWLVATARLCEIGVLCALFGYRRVIPGAFEAGFDRLQCRARQDDEVSRRFIERAGFMEEGVLRGYAAGGVSMVLYGLLKQERDHVRQ